MIVNTITHLVYKHKPDLYGVLDVDSIFRAIFRVLPLDLNLDIFLRARTRDVP